MKGPTICSVTRAREQIASDDQEDQVKKRILIFFVGGITRSELACIRFLNADMNIPCKFFVATTSIISKDEFLNTFKRKIT